MLVIPYRSTGLIAGEDDSDGEVTLLPRDCGRDDSKEVEEELVSSVGVSSPGVVPAMDEAAGSTMTGFALRISSAIATFFIFDHSTSNTK